MNKEKKGSALMPCVVYSLCSIAMVLSNKSLAASFPIDIPILLVVSQCAIAVVLVEASRMLGAVNYSPLDLTIVATWVPVNVAFVSMLLTSFLAFKFLNIPVITVFKNVTNVLIVFGDWWFHGEKVTLGILASFGVMVLGAMMAAYSDVMFSATGYFWMGCNVLSTAAYVLYMRSVTGKLGDKINKFGMVYMNNLLSIPLLLPVAVALGEVDCALENLHVITSRDFLLVNLVAGSMGYLLNLASLWCVSSTSATTYALVGSLNKIPVSLLGVVLFKAVITFEGAVYIGISMLGGFLYTWTKMRGQ